MATYYTQILNRNNKKILTGNYSMAGTPLKGDRDLLIQMKNVISKLPTNEEKIFSVHASSKAGMFFFQIVNELIIASIADARTSNKIIAKYFDEILKAYLKNYKDSNTPHYEFDDSIKNITDAFNKKFNLLTSVEELENTHSALVENLDTLINRGENISNLKELANKISMETQEMSKKVNKIKLKAKMDQYKIYAMIIAAIFLIIYLFFLRR